jgi:hypothetical protein
MPRQRPKIIGPLLPKGGHRTLGTKKRRAENAQLLAVQLAKEG